MSPGQTGHITGQMGRVPGQTGRTPGGVPPKFFMFIGFFLSPFGCPKRKIAPKFHAKTGVKTEKIHANFTLLGCGADISGCRKRRSAKGVQSLFFIFGTLLVTFRSLFLTLSSLSCQTPFAGLLLRQGEHFPLETTRMTKIIEGKA